MSGLVYYRLKQIDRDGTFAYSPVRTATFTKAVVPTISLYPNPATSETTLDATGRLKLGLQLEAGLARSLGLHTITSGTYTVRVRATNGGQPVNLAKRLVKE